MDVNAATQLFTDETPTILGSEPIQQIATLFDARYYLKNNPDVERAGVDPLEHFLIFGYAEKRNPHPLFDIHYYERQLGTPSVDGRNAVQHFLEQGARRGLSPHPMFDPNFYVSQLARDNGEITNALLHFLRHGASRDLNPHPLFDVAYYRRQTQGTIDRGENPLVHFLEKGSHLSPHPLFDSSYYVNSVPDLATSGVNPLVHFLTVGGASGLSPSLSFDTRFYLSKYPDVSESGLNPLVHYLKIGLEERREIKAVRAQPADQTTESIVTLIRSAQLVADREHLDGVAAAMELDWYLEQLDSAVAQEIGASRSPRQAAAAHYLAGGGSNTHLSPHPCFSPDFYLANNSDLHSSSITPFGHYVAFGSREGRIPHPLLKRPVEMSGGEEKFYSEAGLVASALFDVGYYRARYPEASALPLYHYLRYGCRSGASPNHLFDPEYYEAQLIGDERPGDLFLDFMLRGWSQNINPHPLFDIQYAGTLGGYGGKGNPYVTFFNAPWSGKRPHPLFDIEYYKRQFPRGLDGERNPLIHYLSARGTNDHSPHPLFSPSHYRKQLVGESNQPLLLHYLKEGWKQGISPHPLFDNASFLKGMGRRVAHEIPLVTYIINRGGTPHYLFSDEYYAQNAQISLDESSSPLEHFVEVGAQAHISPHPLFDPKYYLDKVRKFASEAKTHYKGKKLEKILKDLNEEKSSRNPLLHYLEVGWKHGLPPHRSFDPSFYREQTREVVRSEPLHHYILRGGAATLSPHPAFDMETYCNGNPDYDPAEMLPFVHLLATKQENRKLTTPLLDVSHYLTSNEDLRKYNICPIRHFWEHGSVEGRLPNIAFSERYVYRLFPQFSFSAQNSVLKFLAERRYQKCKLLFVGHDASRTGAPLILLRILEIVNRLLDVDCYTILGHGGELLTDFKAQSHVYVMRNGLDRSFCDATLHDRHWEQEVGNFMKTFNGDLPSVAICNTAETRAFADAFSKLEIPVISLVHEVADPYDAAQWATVYDASSMVVFPSEYTKKRALRKVPLSEPRMVVCGQGLLDEGFGFGSHEVSRRKVRKELNIPPDGRLVLGCGTIDWRKGADRFVEVANHVLRKGDEMPPVWFVWVGANVAQREVRHWLDRLIDQYEIRERVLFIGPREDPEPYFRAADVFLLTSRADPFPCVVHEAMACRLPVVCFENCTGAPDAFEDSGIAIPAESVEQMVNEIAALLENDERRRLLGERAAQLVRSKWRYSDYVNTLVDHAEALANVKFPRRISPGADVADPTDVTIGSRAGAREKKRVFFCSPDWGISGVNTFTLELIEELNKNGFDARILFTNGRFTPTELMGNLPRVPVTYMQPESYHFRSVWLEFGRFLKENRPCIFVPNYDYIASSISPVLPNGVGVVGIAHSDDVEHYEHVYRLGLYWDRIVSVSNEIRSKIGLLNPRFLEKTRTIYYGVDFDEAVARGAVEQRFHQVAGPINIVYTGRIVTKQKNILRFVELAELLVNANVPFRMTLLGDGEQYSELKWKMAGLIEAGVVSLPGRLPQVEVRRALMQADVFCLLSDFEGLPLSMLEAMAFGVIPVVREVDSGIPEVIVNGQNGYLCSRRDMTRMVSVLKKLQLDGRLRHQLGHKVVDSFIRHRLDRQEMAKSYAELFDTVFEEMANGKNAKPEPLAYNAPIYGVQAPPFLQRE